MSSILENLKAKVETLYNKYKALQAENAELRNSLVEMEQELLNHKAGDIQEVEALKEMLKKKDERIMELEEDNQEKDEQIEAIVARVEELLNVRGTNYY